MTGSLCRRLVSLTNPGSVEPAGKLSEHWRSAKKHADDELRWYHLSCERVMSAWTSPAFAFCCEDSARIRPVATSRFIQPSPLSTNTLRRSADHPQLRLPTPPTMPANPVPTDPVGIFKVRPSVRAAVVTCSDSGPYFAAPSSLETGGPHLDQRRLCLDRPPSTLYGRRDLEGATGEVRRWWRDRDASCQKQRGASGRLSSQSRWRRPGFVGWTAS